MLLHLLDDLRRTLFDAETGEPVSGSVETDPTWRLDRRFAFTSNQLLLKLQYAFRY